MQINKLHYNNIYCARKLSDVKFEENKIWTEIIYETKIKNNGGKIRFKKTTYKYNSFFFIEKTKYF